MASSDNQSAIAATAGDVSQTETPVVVTPAETLEKESPVATVTDTAVNESMGEGKKSETLAPVSVDCEVPGEGNVSVDATVGGDVVATEVLKVPGGDSFCVEEVVAPGGGIVAGVESVNPEGVVPVVEEALIPEVDLCAETVAEVLANLPKETVSAEGSKGKGADPVVVTTKEVAEEGDTDSLFEISDENQVDQEGSRAAVTSPAKKSRSKSSAKTPATRPTSRRKSVSRVLPSRSCLTKRQREAMKESDDEPLPESVPSASKKRRIAKKEMLEEIECTPQWLEEQKLSEILEMLKFQRWDKLFEVEEVVSPSAVSEFYSNLKLEVKGSVYLDFSYQGHELRISSFELSGILDIPHKGYDQFSKGNWPADAEDRYVVQERICGTADHGKVSTKNIPVQSKILHKILVSNLLQRGSKTTFVQLEDILLMDKIIKREPVNLPKLILHQMEYISTHKQVGFARIIKKILVHHDVYQEPKDEVPIVRKFDEGMFKKMGMIFDEDLGWVKDETKAAAADLPAEVDDDEVPPGDEDVSVELRLKFLDAEISSLRREVKELKGFLGELIRSEVGALKEMIRVSASGPST